MFNQLRTAALAFVCLMLAACPGQLNPLTAAETLEQKAFASYGMFVVFEEQAAQLVQDPAMPNDVKRALALADRAAKPVMDNLLAAALEVAAIRAQLAAGETPEQTLEIVTANLNTWLTRALPLVNSLVRTVLVVKRCGKITDPAARAVCEGGVA